MAASTGLQDWWNEKIGPKFPNLGLTETEPVRLSPYSQSSKSKKQKASSLAVLDFLVSDTSKNPPVARFNIEQKTGPGSIDSMKEFQLDVNDFNDIAGATNNSKLLTYVVHVQAVQEYTFPTRRTVVRGIWWTDIYTLQAHQRKIGKRRDEVKDAIYYNCAAFKPIETFEAELRTRSYDAAKLGLIAKPIELI